MATTYLSLESNLLQGKNELERAEYLYKSIRSLRAEAQDHPLSFEKQTHLKQLGDLVAFFFKTYGVPLKELCQMDLAGVRAARHRTQATSSIAYALRERANMANQLL